MTAPPGTWALDRDVVDKRTRVRYKQRVRHLLIDSTHRPAGSSGHEYRVELGGADNKQIAKNVVSMNLIHAEIPRTADNIIEGRHMLHVRALSDASRPITHGSGEGGDVAAVARSSAEGDVRTVTLAPGLYLYP